MSEQTNHTYFNKVYNLWMNKFEWTGLDPELASEQENFIMRKFWSDGTIAVRKTVGDLLVFAPYAGSYYDLYDFPSKVTLVNLRGAPEAVIPSTLQDVNKDVVIGWCQPNHKSIASIAQYYIDRIVQVEMVLNTNLNLQKMPFLIAVSETDRDALQDIVERILNNEVVIFADLEDLQKIQAVITQTPYIIDKLAQYKNSLENELLSFLGIDNAGSNEKKERLIVDEVNAANDMINAYGSSIEEEINKWLEQIKSVLKRNLAIKPRSAPVAAVSEGPISEGGLQSGKAKSHTPGGEE